MTPCSTTLKYTSISRVAFDKVLSRYVSTVPENLRELDAFRYDAIPSKVAQRATKGDVYLEKEEVVKLVEWKLKHGTFRPTLLSLLSSNPAPTIKSTTRTALSTSTLNPTSLQLTAPKALKELTKLKGIGPATASLLLSVSNLALYPFFSDELFRWVMWDTPGSPGGWKRRIKYTVKEYEMLLQGVNELSERLGVKAMDMERVAWVLGKEEVDVGREEVLSGSGDNQDSVDGAVKRIKGKKSVSVKGGGKGEKVGAKGMTEATAEKETEDKVTKKGGKRKAVELEEVIGKTQDGGNGVSDQPQAKKAKNDANRKSIEPKAPVKGLRRSNRRKTT